MILISPSSHLDFMPALWVFAYPVLVACSALMWLGIHAVLIANGRAPLRFHVGHIVEVRSKKQMIGVYARRIVTMMTNQHVAGDRAIYE